MAAKRGKGRPEKDKDEPPMPAKWKETERLAVCLAYLEASERNRMSAQALEAEISKNYATQLDYVRLRPLRLGLRRRARTPAT